MRGAPKLHVSGNESGELPLPLRSCQARAIKTRNEQHDEPSGAQATQVSLYSGGLKAGALARCRGKYHAAIAFA
jgi:hypothetical protein